MSDQSNENRVSTQKALIQGAVFVLLAVPLFWVINLVMDKRSPLPIWGMGLLAIGCVGVASSLLAQRWRITERRGAPKKSGEASARLPADIHGRLASLSRATGRPVAELVAEAVDAHLDELERVHPTAESAEPRDDDS